MASWLSSIFKKQAKDSKEGAAADTSDYPDDIDFDDNPCSSCPDPCTSHGKMPDYLKIDAGPMAGSVKPYRRHLVFFEGAAKRWPGHLDAAGRAPDALAPHFMDAAAVASAKLGYRIVVTAADNTDGAPLPLPPPPREGLVPVMLLPDMKGWWLDPERAGDVKEAVLRFLLSGAVPPDASLQPLQPAGNSRATTAAAATAAMAPSAAAAVVAGEAGKGASAAAAAAAGLHVILVCCHKLRDKRCGVVGPLVVDALRAAAAERGLADKVLVYPCSHTGGHKFAGNVLVYPGGIWYGRVKPCHAGAILISHVIGGKVIRELWRGRISGGGGGNGKGSGDLSW